MLQHLAGFDVVIAISGRGRLHRCQRDHGRQAKLLDHLQGNQGFSQVVVCLGDDEIYAFLYRPGQLFLVHGSHDTGGRHGIAGIICPGIADIACDKRVTLAGDFVGKLHRLTVHPFEVILPAYILQLFAMGIVGQGDHHLASRPEELPVQFFDRLREIKDDFWNVRASLDIAPAFKFKYIALGSLDNTLAQSLQDAPGCGISHGELLLWM